MNFAAATACSVHAAGSVSQPAVSSAIQHATSTLPDKSRAWIPETQRQHWRRLAALKALAATRPLLSQVASLASSKELRQDFEVGAPNRLNACSASIPCRRFQLIGRIWSSMNRKRFRVCQMECIALHGL